MTALMLIAGLGCIVLSWLILPFFAVAPRKFALLYTLGSGLVFFSSSFVKGYANFFQYAFSKERLWYTIIYLVAMMCTLIAVFKHTYFLVIFCSIAQMIAMVLFLMSHIPGGIHGLGFVARFLGGRAIQI